MTFLARKFSSKIFFHLFFKMFLQNFFFKFFFFEILFIFFFQLHISLPHWGSYVFMKKIHEISVRVLRKRREKIWFLAGRISSTKVRATHISKQSISHKTINRPSSVLKIVTIKVLSLLHLCTKIHIDISSRLRVIGVWKVENRTHTDTHSYIQTASKNHISRHFRLFWVLWR